MHDDDLGHSPGDDDAREAAGSFGDAPVSDADLIRFLDGELPGAASVALESRLAGDAVLAARYALLKGRSERLSNWLGLLDAPAQVPAAEGGSARGRAPASEGGDAPAVVRGPGAVSGRRPSARGAWLRAAAAVALLAIAVAVVPPAMAWVVGHVRQVAAALGFGAPNPGALAPWPEPGAAEAPAMLGVRFPVAGDTLVVDVGPTAGELVVTRTQGAAGAGAAELRYSAETEVVYLPDGVRLRGPESGGTTYALTVPANVVAVRVVAGVGPDRVFEVGHGAAEAQIPLPEP